MKQEISLSPIAIRTMEQILVAGKELRAYAGNGRLTIWEADKRKKYEVTLGGGKPNGKQ